MLGRAVRIVHEGGLRVDFAAGDGGGEAGHLERGRQDEALADGHVGGVTGEPFFPLGAFFPGVVGDEHPAGFAGQFDAGAAVEVEAAGFGRDHLGRGAPADFVEIDIAAFGDRLAEQDVVVDADAVVADEAAVEALEHALAVDDGLVGGDGSAAEAGDGGEDFVGGAGRVETAEGAVELAAFGLDPGVGGGADARGKLREIVVGFADHRQDFAGGNVEGDGGADLVADGLFGGELEVDVEGTDKVFALDGEAFFEGRVDFVAGGIDAEDGAAGFALQLVVEGFLKAVFADGAGHFEGGEVFAGEVVGGDVVVDPDIPEGVGGGGAEGVGTGARGVNLEGGAHREALDQAGVFLAGEVVDQGVGEEELVAEVAGEGLGVDLFGAVQDFVHLVEVVLDDADAGHLGERQVGEAGGAVVAADDAGFAEEFGFEFVEVEHDGEAGAVADEDGDAVAGVDVAARAGDEDAALALDAFALVVGVGFEQLLVGESAGEDEEEGGDDEVEEDDARVVALVGLEEAAGVVGEIGLGRGHRARRRGRGRSRPG